MSDMESEDLKPEHIRSAMDPVYDVYGQQIEVGRWVSYPVRGSSDCWLSHGEVVAIERERRYNRDVIVLRVRKRNGRRTQRRGIHDVVCAPAGWTPDIQVRNC